ncbi:MAG TPA: MBL fold metallo-hydrolase [Nitrospirota bacterium]|nr:MBL fold metallo-hydrolase [Nitrospirota bacterium]
MSEMNRRQFIKTVSVAVGAAAMTGAVPVAAETKTPGDVKSSGSQVNYEVFALKYAGPFERKMAMIMFNTGWSEDIAINYYIWAIRSKDGETTLVDTGTGPTLAKERGFKGFVPPEQVVARLGIKPEQVTKVVLTHLHFDHVGGMENFPQLYPKAKFYVQKTEFDFWINNPISKRAPFKGLRWDIGNKGLADLAGSPRLVMVDGDLIIRPNMELLLTPGHTPGLQGVLIDTAKGPAVVASDSAHIARSYKDDVPSGLIVDMVVWLKSYDKLRSKASVANLFPGHDTLMLSGYPRVAEDITQLV